MRYRYLLEGIAVNLTLLINGKAYATISPISADMSVQTPSDVLRDYFFNGAIATG